ncbi:MAG: ABC transporter permease [Butyricicoccus sp.]
MLRCDRHCARLLSFGGVGQSAARENQSSYMPTVEQFTVLPSETGHRRISVSALLGIIFGLYPANKASNLQPVDALRTQ